MLQRQIGDDAVGLLPVGTVTFVFTDIEGSTRLLRRLGARYGDVLDVHDELVGAALCGAGGVLFGSRGDALFAAFADPVGAVAGALEAQRALGAYPWGAHDVRVRTGVHTGEGCLRSGTYIGLDVHRAARICAVARGGHVLVSLATVSLTACDLPAGARLVDRGLHRLKDLPEPDRLYELVHPDLVAGATA